MAAPRSLLKLLDIRFPDVEDEVAFAKSLQADLVRCDCFGKAVCAVCSALYFWKTIWEEVDRQDKAFVWGREDPRTYFFIAWLTLTIFYASLCCYSLGRICWRIPASWKWEKITLVTWTLASVALVVLNQWYWPLLFRQDPTNLWVEDARGVWIYVPLSIDLNVTVVCLFIPIRVHQVGIIPLCCISMMLALDFSVGSAFQGSSLLTTCMLVVLSSFALCSAWRNEWYRREEWRAMEQVTEAKEVMQQQSEQIKEQEVEIEELGHGQVGELTSRAPTLHDTDVPVDKSHSRGRRLTRCSSRGSSVSATEEGSILDLHNSLPGEMARTPRSLSTVASSTMDVFDGDWEIVNPNDNTQSWIRRLHIAGNLVICGDGEESWLKQRDGEIYFEGGRLYMDGDELNRVKTTSHFRFRRVECYRMGTFPIVPQA